MTPCRHYRLLFAAAIAFGARYQMETTRVLVLTPWKHVFLLRQLWTTKETCFYLLPFPLSHRQPPITVNCRASHHQHTTITSPWLRPPATSSHQHHRQYQHLNATAIQTEKGTYRGVVCLALSCAHKSPGRESHQRHITNILISHHRRHP